MVARLKAGLSILTLEFVLITAGSLLVATPATAGPAEDPAILTMVHEFDHPMGSQIALHEGRVAAQPVIVPAGVPGMDVSGWQGNVDWAKAWASGAKFAYVKASEGTDYQNPYFEQQYDGSYQVGMIRGAYHFAHPDVSSGAAQANYFIANGGGWSPDGKTLPGALDIEWQPKGDPCYGLSQDAMVAWIKDFSNQYRAKTRVWPVIYTATTWWTRCIGNKGDFTANSPLWVARYANLVGPFPYNWSYYTFWQYANSGTFPGDQNVFNGSYQQLQAVAKG